MQKIQQTLGPTVLKWSQYQYLPVTKQTINEKNNFSCLVVMKNNIFIVFIRV